MQERSVQHTTFVIERSYGASPKRVFAAWANQEAKAKWFPGPKLFDFRVGGREYHRQTHEGVTYTYDATYQDIVPDQRIAFTYIVDRDETRLSVSVTTVEMKPEGTGTRLIYTEQGAFFDGTDKPEDREHGTRLLLDALDKALQDELMLDEKIH
ncbi:polyketide cyclase [Ktedonosporobacter rubrisoli]|uniref:Polyketide cyclase n=1 Tax=Ktedonosporobacter rubrisoli TaxID=2509675 RepID=A0A4P6JL72_KTERU|nr:SRPBCC family protein [Ktedonosporobacter rubrisoli]QBD75977.1 polyketide cyclase [Ktedonosporobacter rubrisoli]